MTTPDAVTVDRDLEGNRDLERTLRRYALGTLGEPARLEVEARLIQEPSTFELLGVIEQELVEDYLEGTLAKADREGFDRHFLTSPDHQRQLTFLRALREAASSTASGPARVAEPPWRDRLRDLFDAPAPWQGAFAAAAILFFAVTAWLWEGQRRLQSELASLRPAGGDAAAARVVPPERISREAPPAPPATALPPTLAPPVQQTSPIVPIVPTFALAAPLRRGEGTLTRISEPVGVPVVRFRLDAPGEPYPSYRVVLFDENGDERCAFSALQAVPQAGKRTLTVSVPSELLDRGDYQLEASGVTSRGSLESLGRYTIRVTAP